MRAPGELTGCESDEGCFTRGAEASSTLILTAAAAAPDPPLGLMGMDADQTSTSVNCARPKTSSSFPSTSISSSTSLWFVSLT